MSKLLMESLSLDLPALAKMIQEKGRGKDTVLAHITPKEAALLKRRGGRGSRNPATGLLEFEDEFDASTFDIGFGPGEYTDTSTPAPADIQGTTFTPDQNAMYGYTQPDTPIVDPSAAFAAAPDQAAVQQQAAALTPYLGGSIEEALPTGGPTAASATFAAANPQLYPGGVLPPQGYGTVYTPTGQAAYAPIEDLEAYAAAQPSAATSDQPTKKKEESYLDKLLSADTLAKLGVAGLLGGYLTRGVAQPAAQKATQQAQQAAQQYQQLAQPYRSTAQNLIKSAQTGALTPSNLQAINTARQISAQNIRSRGGVGVEQAANQVAQLEANLLENQFNTGLKVANIADQFDAQAIQTALSANQNVVASNAAFYAQLANMLAPFVFGTGQMTSPQQQVTRASTTGGGF